jgi:hypothetical protein
MHRAADIIGGQIAAMDGKRGDVVDIKSRPTR